MAKTNYLTLEIENKTNDTIIQVELDNKTMFQLYRIKEIHNYHSMIEIDLYRKFCKEMQEKVEAFTDSINQKYLDELETIDKEQYKKNSNKVQQSMDEFLLAGYGFDFALSKSKKYLL